MYLDKLHDDSSISDVKKFEVINKLSSKDNVSKCVELCCKYGSMGQCEHVPV